MNKKDTPKCTYRFITNAAYLLYLGSVHKSFPLPSNMHNGREKTYSIIEVKIDIFFWSK